MSADAEQTYPVGGGEHVGSAQMQQRSVISERFEPIKMLENK